MILNCYKQDKIRTVFDGVSRKKKAYTAQAPGKNALICRARSISGME